MRGMTSHDSSVIVIRVTDDVRVAEAGLFQQPQAQYGKEINDR